jgi:tetratricopeptide (TPR) repeat protein
MLALCIAVTLSPAAHAQGKETPPPLPAEYSESARKAYTATMKDVRDLMAKKRYDDAIVKLDALSKDRPREPQSRFLKGVALSELGRDDAAIDQFQALTADFPELPEPHNNLAALFARKGQYDSARRELELAIAADPDYGIANENLGDVYVRLAGAQYERAAKLQKNNKTVPLKLKLVRDVLAVKADPPASATAGAVTDIKEKSQ